MVEEVEIEEQQQPDPPSKKRALYDAVSKKYSLGTYEEFESKLKDPTKRKLLYDHVGKEFELGTYQDFESKIAEPSKKKVGTIVLGDSYSTPTLDSETPLPTNTEIPTVTDYGNGELVQDDVVSISKQYGKLKDATKIVPGLGDRGTEREVPDEEVRNAASIIKFDLEAKGYNPDKLAEDFDFPEYVFNAIPKEKLLEDYKTNPQLYEREIATAKWQSSLLDNMMQEGKGDLFKGVTTSLDNITNEAIDYRTKRNNIHNIVSTINQFGGDKRESMLRNLSTDLSNVYAEAAANPDKLKDEPLFSKLNSNQLAAWNLLEDTEPKEANKYRAALLDDKDIKDNPEAQLQKQEAGRRLDELGIQMQKSYAREKLAPLIQEYNAIYLKGENMTPEEQQRMVQLEQEGKKYEDILNNVNEDESNLVSNYPKAAALDAENFAQELVGMKHDGILGLDFMAMQMGRATENTAKGIVDFVKAPFLSDRENEINQAEILGGSLLSDNAAYLSQGKQTEKTFKPTLSGTLQVDVDAIKNSNLSNREKLDKVTDLLMSRTGEWRRTPIEGGKTNIGLTSLMYGVGGLAANLAPFMAAEMVTGGGASAGVLRKFTSAFTAAAATGYHDSYVEALKSGSDNPYADAARRTAINSAAMAGAGTPDAIRKMLGNKTAIGKLINSMTDDAIQAALKSEPKALSTFRKSFDAVKKAGGIVKDAAVTGFKSGAKLSGFTTGGQVVNDAIDGELKTPADYAKQAAIETLKFTILGGIGGTLGKIGSKPSDISLAAVHEAARNPEGFNKALETMVKDGNISSVEATQVRNNIETVTKIYKQSPIINNLKEKDKREYLWNAMVKAEAKEAAANLPGKQGEKAEHTALVADYKNSFLLEPKTDKQLDSRLNQIEKELTPEKKDDGTTVPINEKLKKELEAERDAINETVDYKKSLDADVKMARKELQKSTPDKLVEELKERNPIYKDAEAEPLLKEIAEQAQNISDGKLNDTMSPEAMYEQAVKQYGSKELVDAAIEKYPAEKLLTNETKATETNIPIEAEVKEPTVTEVSEVGEGTESGVFVEGKRTILSHRGLQEVATEWGLDDITSRERKSDLQLFKDAETTIGKWVEDGSYPAKVEALVKEAESGRVLNDEQRVIVQQHIANVRGELKGMDVNSKGYDAKLKELSRLVKAGEQTRSAAGAALRVPNMGATEQRYDLPDIMVGHMEALGVDKLTETQKAEAIREYENIKKKTEEAQAKLNEVTAKYQEMLAEKELKKGTHGKKQITGKKDYKAERQSLKDKLKTQLEEFKAAGQKLGVSSDGGAESFILSAKMAKTVAEIVKSHVAEIGADLKEVTKRTFEDVKDLLKGITEKQIHDVIAGEYAEKRKTRNELAAQMRDVRDEAMYINKLDKLYAEGEPKTDKQRTERNRKILELRSKIKDISTYESDLAKIQNESLDNATRRRNELEQKLSKAEKELDAKDTKARRLAEKEAERQRKELEKELAKKTPEQKALEAVKKRNEAQTKKIKEDIANGNFEKEKKVSWIENKEYKAKQPKLFKEALDAMAAKEDAKHEYDLALYKEQMANRSKVQKVGDFLAAGANTTKKVVTGIDDSALGIQTLAAMAARPIVGLRAIKLHALDAFSQKRFDRGLTELHNSSDYDLMKKSGLDITEPKSLSAEKKEEAFGGETWDIKFKLKGKEYKVLGGMLKPFERAFTSLGNGMRVIAFRTIAEKLAQEGYTFEKNPQVFKDLALMLNTETGRGKQNEYIQKASELVTAGIWSPKLMASRLNMLGISDALSYIPGVSKAGTKGYYRNLDPRIRKEAYQDVIKFTSAVVTMSYLAAWATGGTVDNDPDSQTFLDIKDGDKSYNLSGGFSQYIRLVAQTIRGGKKSNGEFKEFDVNRDKNRGSNLLHFMRGKVTPMAGVGIDLLTQKDFAGNPVELGSEVKKLTIPLSMQNVVSGIEKDGYSSLFTTTLPNFVGINVKDKRDFIDQDLTVPEWRFLADKNLKVVSHKKETLKPIDEEGKPQEVTEEKYKKFVKKREDIIQESIKQLRANGANYEDEEGEIVEIAPPKVKDISTDDLKKWLMSTTSKATDAAIEEIWGVQGKEKKKSTIKTNE